MVRNVQVIRVSSLAGNDASLMTSVQVVTDGSASPPMLYENIHFKSCWGIRANGTAYWTDGFAPDSEAAMLVWNLSTGAIYLTSISNINTSASTVAASLTAVATMRQFGALTVAATLSATAQVRVATTAPATASAALSAVVSGQAVTIDTTTAKSTSTATLSAAQTTKRATTAAFGVGTALAAVGASGTASMTRSGSSLLLAGTPQRFGGANAYWLGLDDNNGTSAGSFPSHTQITNAFTGMTQMGVNLVRAHSIGISTGTSKSYETAVGVYNDANLDSADYAVYQAKQHGTYLMIPMTDNWNYYHGGKWNFVHWAYQQNPGSSANNDVIIDTPGSTKDDPNERQFFANTVPGQRIRALYKDYISHWLNHVNPYTGLAYKDDPTIAIIETGNELYYVSQLGSNEWTQDIASYIKSIAPNKLVSDGSAADRVFVSNSPGLTASAVDIVSAHYYPQQQSGSYPPVPFADTTSGYAAGTALKQITADATNAANANKVFIVGEYPWTRSDVASLYSTVESTKSISADMFWAVIASSESGVAETHGGAFGSDDFPVHRPYSGSNETQYAPALARHISAVGGIANTNGAGSSPVGTTNLVSNKSISHASDYTLFTAGSGSLSNDTSVSQEGGSSMKVTPSGAGVYPYIYPTTPSQGAPVTAGSTYTGVVSVYNVTSGNFGFQAVLNWYNSGGTYLSNSTGSYVGTSQGSWTQVTASDTAPSGAAYVTVQIQAGSSMNAADLFNLDEFGVFVASNTIWSA